MKQLDAARLADVLFLTHAAREHTRQIKKQTLGLATGEVKTREERCRIFAEYLLDERTDGGARTVQDVLMYVLWGDSETKSAAERIWAAGHDAEWKLPHLGVNIFGEMIGSARPDDYPPRNHRVVRSLYALGYEGIGL